jgi:hypothetical protein
VNYTDEMFVSVSKGSVYFIPAMMKTVDKQVGKPLDVTIKGDAKAALLFQKANARVERKDGRLMIKGDMGQILGAALKDADLVFKGEDKELQDRYGYAGKAAVRTWWSSLKAIEKGLRIAGFVLCYVLYTIWWGFSIYFLCEGVGLLMTKAKKKSEA